MSVNQISGWGNFPSVTSVVHSPSDIQEVIDIVKNKGSLIPTGNFRSYGDAALNEITISSKKLNKIIDFDLVEGTIECEAGVLLSDVLKKVVPKGFFLGVTPGTKYVSVGGAIAADVHGKNHHKEGTFSTFLKSITIVDERGAVQVCSPVNQPEKFWRIVGGMGTTGIIISAVLQLKRISSSQIQGEQIQAKNLKEMIEVFKAKSDYTYSVAWIDCLAKGQSLGRGVISFGEHALEGELKVESKSEKKLPIPSLFLNPFTIAAFNKLYFWKGKSKALKTGYESFFYPLDGIKYWNRMYGKNGFIQYQFVLPLDTSEAGLTEIIEFVSKHKMPPFLTVLKLMGKGIDQCPHSFPMEGFTLAMDFKWHPGIHKLVVRLDSLVTKHKGKVYLAKDSLSGKEVFPSLVEPSNKFIGHQRKRLNISMEKENKSALILGGTSEVSIELAKEMKEEGWEVVLTARSQESKNELEKLTDLGVELFDIESIDWEWVEKATLKYHSVFSFIGYCPIPQDKYSSTQEVAKTFSVNFTAVAEVIEKFVHSFERRGFGNIVGVTSVSGDRGRGANYLYGSAKAGFNAYLSGIRNRLYPSGVHVLTVNPGYMDTKMVASMELPGLLTVSPKQGAAIIHRAFKKKKNVVYVSWKWYWVMMIIRNIPEAIFKKLKL